MTIYLIMYLMMGLVIFGVTTYNHVDYRDEKLITAIIYVIVVFVSIVFGWGLFMFSKDRNILYASFLSAEDYDKYYDEMFRSDELDL